MIGKGNSCLSARVRSNRPTMTVIGSALTALLAGCSAGTGGSSIAAQAVGVVAPTASAGLESSVNPTPATSTVGPTFAVGINVARSVYYSTERTFANLAKGSAVWRDSSAGWSDIPASGLTAANYPAVGGVLTINVPQTVRSGITTQVTCTWTGSGNVSVNGVVRARASNHTLSFNWPGAANSTVNPFLWVSVDSVSAADPFTNLDCREPGLVANGAFDQRLVEDLKPYSVLRFLDWSTANSNPVSVTWEARSSPDNLVQNGSDGIALEHMIDLANATDSDAWFTVPWNADQNYVVKMAALVRDRLSPKHKAYFELSNETWNYGFPVATQALNEGLAEKLSADHYSNSLLRYAEKSTWLNKLLTNAFAGNMPRLVRVLNVQNGQDWGTNLQLSFSDTAQYVDAIASAPYFGHSFFDSANSGVTDLTKLFASLETMRVETIGKAVLVQAVAARHNKLYITYEGGQHIIPRDGNAGDKSTAAAMERSPLMYDIYARYLKDLKALGVGTSLIYSATGDIGKHGAWGIREYAGQPLTETPKRRAVLEFTRSK